MRLHLHLTTILLIIFEHIIKVLTQGIPISPCPKMFQYRFDGAEWFGILSIRNPDIGQALHLRVTLSMRGKPTTNYLGEIELLTRGQFQSESPVLYKVKFPKSHFPPKLLQVSTNEQIVCLGAADHSIFVTQIQLEHTRKFTFIPDDVPLPLQPGFMPTAVGEELKDAPLLPVNSGFGAKHLPAQFLDSNPTRSLRDICGTIDDRIRFQVLQGIKHVATPSKALTDANSFEQFFARKADEDDTAPLITTEFEQNAGSATPTEELPTIARGAWPWLAAIYVNNLTSLTYQCGGTLVSRRVVISAAHCFQMFKRRYSANEVLVFLGRHNLKNWNEEGSLAAPVDDIFLHPEFDSNLNSYDADVAVVMLKNEVRFNTFIRPACLWSGSTSMQYIEGEHGVVVGWGLGNQNLSTSSSSKAAVPQVVNAPVVSNAVCFSSNQKLRSLSSNRTFCAGNVAPQKAALLPAFEAQRQQTGPCAGDSGAGLMIFKNSRWLLRGTVSARLPQDSSKDANTKFSCSFNQYVIYTDVAKFLDWIFAFII